MTTETDQLTRGGGRVVTPHSEPGRPPGRPMRQLEFNQAMSDFRHMFPETEEEVIEAVLRANNGMVDATIDQLLTMNIDQEADLPDHILVQVEKDLQQHSVSRRSSKEARAAAKKAQSGEDFPPSYTEAVQSHRSTRTKHRSPHPATLTHLCDLGPDTAPQGATGVTSIPSAKGHHSHSSHNTPRAFTQHRRKTADLTESSSHKTRPGRNLLAQHSTLHEAGGGDDIWFKPQRRGSLDSSDSDRIKSVLRQTYGKRPAYRDWNPPLLGTLPDDFLRLMPATVKEKSGRHLCRAVSACDRPASRDRLVLNPGLHCLSDQRPLLHPVPHPLHHAPLRSATIDHAPTDGTTHRASHESSSRHRSPHKTQRSLSFTGHTHHHRSKAHSGRPEPLSTLLQSAYKENERRRRTCDLDPDLAQYLEDERLAIMMQNSEFLQELRGDTAFMTTLEEDQQARSSEPPSLQESAASDPPAQGHGHVSPSFSPEEDMTPFIEGYGDESRTTLEAFPFSQQLPAPADKEDVELRKKLRNMGRASRKQFASLARKFFHKRKKKSTAQQILGRGCQAPSMANLLGEDDEEDLEEVSDPNWPHSRDHVKF